MSFHSDEWDELESEHEAAIAKRGARIEGLEARIRELEAERGKHIQRERERILWLIENERIGADETEQGRGYGLAIRNILHAIQTG